MNKVLNGAIQGPELVDNGVEFPPYALQPHPTTAEADDALKGMENK